MKNVRVFSLFLIIAALAPLSFADSKFKVLKKINLIGDASWDGLTLDSEGRRLYAAHGTRVNVLDIDNLAPLKVIYDTPGVHAVAITASLGRGFISQGKTDSVVIFDHKSLKKIGEVGAGRNPDAIVFDPATSRVFVFNTYSRNATVIDAKMGEAVSTLSLPGRPESAIADGFGLLYVIIEDKNSLVKINSRDLKVEAAWTLTGCESPSSLAMDAAHRLLFVGCKNKTLAVVNANDGKLITTLSINERVDGLAFDPEPALLFASSGDGTLTVVHEESPAKFRVIESVTTEPGARALALDPKTHRLFLAAAQMIPRPGETRPTIAPGTFNVLVMGQ